MGYKLLKYTKYLIYPIKREGITEKKHIKMKKYAKNRGGISKIIYF